VTRRSIKDLTKENGPQDGGLTPLVVVLDGQSGEGRSGLGCSSNCAASRLVRLVAGPPARHSGCPAQPRAQLGTSLWITVTPSTRRRGCLASSRWRACLTRLGKYLDCPQRQRRQCSERAPALNCRCHRFPRMNWPHLRIAVAVLVIGMASFGFMPV
jgi:hypothetical protein